MLLNLLIHVADIYFHLMFSLFSAFAISCRRYVDAYAFDAASFSSFSLFYFAAD